MLVAHQPRALRFESPPAAATATKAHHTPPPRRRETTMRPQLSLLILCLTMLGGWPGAASAKDNPPVVSDFNTTVMDAAIAEAKTTLPAFIALLKTPPPAAENFSIKKGFSYGEEGMEFIWLGEVKQVGNDFEASIGNEPVHVKGLKLGQRVKVMRDEVVDWMYMANGRLRGGYTIAALIHGTAQQAGYERALKIDWSQYQFLKPRPAPTK